MRDNECVRGGGCGTRKRQSATMAGVFVVLFAASPGYGLVSSEQGPGPFEGLNINSLLGADRFYSNGYTGTRATVINIEAGHVWNQHDTLTHVGTFLHNPSIMGTELGSFDFHATAVGQAIAGRGTNSYEVGIAYGADLWSGAIATSWGDCGEYCGNFSIGGESFAYPYITALATGVGGKTADVFNSSWGFGEPTGFNYFTVAADALLNQTGKIGVISAGNAGEGPNAVGGLGAGFNSITVAALGADTEPTPYNRPSTFSSGGPNDYHDPITDTVIPGVRAPVDIAAPGQNLTLAFYGGVTGGHRYGSDPTMGDTDFYLPQMAGTSFSSPIVAGGASLLVDVGYDVFGGGSAIDGRVIKAVLLNSADKTMNWDNGQMLTGDTITTTQSLDYRVGAGRMNLDRAYDQYLSGTTGVALRGGGVESIGWDYGSVDSTAPAEYYIAQALVAGSTFSATLTWFVDYTWDYETSLGELYTDSFDNLDLQIWRVDGGGVPTDLIAQSISLYNTVEHLSFEIPVTGHYMIRVIWAGEHYDFVDDLDAEFFGLAWYGVAVPAPGALALFSIGIAAVTRRRRTN